MQNGTLPARRWQPPTALAPSPPTNAAQVAQRAAAKCKQLARSCEATAQQLAADPLAVVYWRDEAARFRRHASDWAARAQREGGSP